MEPLDLFSLLRAIAALAFTLGLILGCSWLAKRYGWGSTGFTLPGTSKPTRRVTVVEKTALTAQTGLYLIQHEDTEHLLAVSPQQTTVISTHKITAGKKPEQKKK